VKRITVLLITLIMAAGCSQSDEASTAATNVAPEPAQQPVAEAAMQTQREATPEPAAASVETEAAAAPAAQSQERIQLAQVDLSAVAAAGFVEGQHYRRLSPAQPVSTSPGTVEVDEFFMHSCIHCYNLEPYVAAWLPEKPDFINFVRIPTTWDPARRMHAQAFYTAIALDKEEEMHMPFFREMHDRGNYLTSPDAMADFFSQFDVSRDQFESTFDSFAVTMQVNRADELGRRYRVDSTPTIIINGKYRTDAGMAGGYEELFELIELLAAAELGQ
jgi:thiol:disulfide interchange protein DsbA